MVYCHPLLQLVVCSNLDDRVEFVVATGDLVISSIRGSDTGNYTCMASNDVGVASADVEVIVRGE